MAKHKRADDGAILIFHDDSDELQHDPCLHRYNNGQDFDGRSEASFAIIGAPRSHPLAAVQTRDGQVMLLNAPRGKSRGRKEVVRVTAAQNEWQRQVVGQPEWDGTSQFMQYRGPASNERDRLTKILSEPPHNLPSKYFDNERKDAEKFYITVREGVRAIAGLPNTRHKASSHFADYLVDRYDDATKDDEVNFVHTEALQRKLDELTRPPRAPQRIRPRAPHPSQLFGGGGPAGYR